MEHSVDCMSLIVLVSEISSKTAMSNSLSNSKVSSLTFVATTHIPDLNFFADGSQKDITMEIKLSQCVNGLVLAEHSVTLEKHAKGIWFSFESDGDDDIMNIRLGTSSSKCVRCIEEPSTRLRRIFTIASGDEVRLWVVGRVKTRSDAFEGGLQDQSSLVQYQRKKIRTTLRTEARDLIQS